MDTELQCVSCVQDYATADEFFEAILKAWHAEWQRVYSFDWSQSQPFEDGGVDYAVYYTPSIKILSVLAQGSASLVAHLKQLQSLLGSDH